MDEHRPASDTTSEAPFLQRMYDRPFLLLAIGLVIMLGIYTFWGLWEIWKLPVATLP